MTRTRVITEPTDQDRIVRGDVLLYQLTTWDTPDKRLPEAEAALVSLFLTAHNVSPMAFMAGNTIYVYERPDGTRYVLLWRALGNDAREAPACPHCPCCVQQELVEATLGAPVPVVGDAYLRDGSDLEVVRLPAEAEPGTVPADALG